MSLITGALYPDEGWAMVGGFDVVKERGQLRKSLGVCPVHILKSALRCLLCSKCPRALTFENCCQQFDVLYSELTCWEHMHLYGAMQGLRWARGCRPLLRMCVCKCVCVCVLCVWCMCVYIYTNIYLTIVRPSARRSATKRPSASWASWI